MNAAPQKGAAAAILGAYFPSRQKHT